MSAAHKTARTARFVREFTNSPWTRGRFPATGDSNRRMALVDVNLRNGEHAYALIDRLHDQGIRTIVYRAMPTSRSHTER
jgi:hypothetical protein